MRFADGATPTDYQFTGQYSHMSDFGLYFFNARWYDPYITQFSQPDAIIPDLNNPQDWNRYSYGLNNPSRYTDPTGHKPCWATSRYSCDLSGWSNKDAKDEINKYKDHDKAAVEAFFESRGFTVQGNIIDSGGNIGILKNTLMESWWQGGYSTTMMESWWQGGFSTIPGSMNERSWIESILASKEMPLAMAAIQVLTVDGIPFAVGVTGGIGPEDLPITLGLFTLSRGAAILGTTATFYQYSHGLNDTRLTDVAESAGTTIAGFWPSATITAVHTNLFYSAYRYWGGELPTWLP